MFSRTPIVCAVGGLLLLVTAPQLQADDGTRRAPEAWRLLVNDADLKAAQVLVPERVRPDDALSYPEQTSPAFIRAARHQHESLQFTVELANAEHVMDLGVTFGSLRDDAGNELDDVRVYEVIYLTTDTPSDGRDYPVGEWPEPLFETDWPERIADSPLGRRNIAAMERAQRRTFWVTVHVPRDAEPGTYTADVTLTLDSERAAGFAVELQVDPFTIPQRSAMMGVTGVRGWSQRRENFEALGLSESQVDEATSGLMDQYRRIILAYGWAPTMWWGFNNWREWADYGRTGAFRAGPGESEQWLKDRDLLAYAWTYTPAYGQDDEVRDETIEWATAFKQESDVQVLGRYFGESVEPLFGLVDIWVRQDPTAAHWGESIEPHGWGRMAVERREAGDRFFNFEHVRYVEHEPVLTRAEFWDEFVQGYTGRYTHTTIRWGGDNLYAGHWMDMGGEDGSGRDWDTGNYVGCAIFPGPHGLVPGIRMETLRDGLYDFDYLALLREAVNHADDADSDALDRARAILEDADLGARVRTAAALHETRNEIADLIIALR